MAKPIWARSVFVDRKGLPWVDGKRADFIYVLFMHGYSIRELRHNMLDGMSMSSQQVEDAIRWGLAQRSVPHKSVAADEGKIKRLKAALLEALGAWERLDVEGRDWTRRHSLHPLVDLPPSGSALVQSDERKE